MKRFAVSALGFVLITLAPFARAADEPDLIFRKSTVFHLMSPNDKLATYAIDDPAIDGVACHFTMPERGGWKRLGGPCGGGVRHFACLPAGRADQVHGQVRAGR